MYRLFLSALILAMMSIFSPLHASERPLIYHAIDPAFVVNIQDGPRPRFMQVKIQIMTHHRSVVSDLEANLPPVRHAMILLLSSQTGDTMRDPLGREQVREQALAVMRDTLARVAGMQGGVEAIYFTDLVIQ